MAALLLAAFPAAAQDAAPPASPPAQTLASARQFLAQVLVGQRMFSQNILIDGKHTDVDHRMERFYGAIASVDINDPNECKIAFVYNQSSFSYNGDTWNPFVENAHTTAADWGAIDLKTTETGAPLIDITITGKPGHWGVIVIPENLAKRVAYAMDFMRVKCDRTKGLAF